MDLYRNDFERVVGGPLVSGSLNVDLENAWTVGGDPIRLGPPAYPIGMSIVPCEINGLAAFILRTDKNDSGGGDHTTTVVEIAAAVHLRTALGLEDGDEVEIVIGG